MSAGKIFGAIIISILMIASTCLCMASFTATNAITENSIKQALEESGALDEIKSQVPVSYLYNINQSYGQAVENALNSDSVDEYISTYLAAAIAAQLAGESVSEISESELNSVISAALDEEVSSGASGITSAQAAIIKKSLSYATPTLVENINSQIDSFTADSLDEDEQQAMEGLRLISSTGFKIGTALVALLCCMLLVMIFWRSRLGLLWAAINMFISSLIFMGVSMQTSSISTSDESVINKMIFMMAGNGAETVAKAGAIIGVIMLILCAIMRLTSRKSRRSMKADRAYR